MSTSNNRDWIKPFLTGVVATAATFHFIDKINRNGAKLFSKRSNSDSNTKGATSNSNNNNNTNTASSNDFVSPTLDQRILRKAETALQNRTSRLKIVVERCTNDHNYSAILRTAEALGVQHVYIIDPQACNSTLKKVGGGDDVVGVDTTNGNDNDTADITNTVEGKELYRSTGQKVQKYSQSEVKDRAQHHLFAQRALEWLQVTEFKTTKQCIDQLREEGYDIWSTDLSQVAVCLTKEGLQLGCDGNGNGNGGNNIPEKLAIVFGTEAVGCTAEMLNASDKRVYLPLRGFADSLNLSVATALVIHQLFALDPTLIGSMPNDERVELRRQWYSKLASQRLLSKSMKAKRRRLVSTIHEYSKLEWRMNNPGGSLGGDASGNNGSGAGDPPLQAGQKAKVAKLKSLRQELKEIDDDLQAKSLKAVEDLVHNPVQPLGDMRRADAHRTTYVGKNTKKIHQQEWGDMPATDTFHPTNLATASFFRDRVKD
jgi:tRNA G18 (ribose-2'-O)-methylase SpoU